MYRPHSWKLPDTSSNNAFLDMWKDTWQALHDKNPYLVLMDDMDDFFDEDIIQRMVETQICFGYDGQGIFMSAPSGSLEKILEEYDHLKDEEKELLKFFCKGYVEYIKSYLDNHNIQMVHIDGDNTWDIVAFLHHFLQEPGNKKSKVAFYDERFNYENGEYIVCDTSFVEQCLKDNKMPDLPSAKMPNLPASLQKRD